jgi:dihydroorotate dehydrogenase (fumarate)
MITLGVAAGHVKLPGHVEPLLRVPSDILRSITLGSYTLEPRPGNPGNAFWTSGQYRPASINALGLPNPGIGVARSHLHTMADRIRESGKRMRISIAGFSPKEYRLLAQESMGLGPCELELNLGCPNVWEGATQKRITSFVPELVRETLERVYEVTDQAGAPLIAVKLSVYSDPYLLEEVAGVLSDMSYAVQSVVACNTFPNATGYNPDGTTVIGAADGYGGLAGNPLKHIALGQVRAFRRLLPHTIDIVGVGGIMSGADVRDMERAGGSSVQVGTLYFENADPSVFVTLMEEYAMLSDS